jgi:hypothetical protein
MKFTPLKKKRPLAGTFPVSPKKKRVVGKNKPKKPKSKSIAKLKKELEALQKQVVLLLYGRDCYTCNAKDLQGSNCQLGHVPWSRTDISIATKFSYEYTRIQCMVCNVHKGGMGAVALQRMIDEGIDVILLRKISQEGKGQPVPRVWYEEKIAYYKGILEPVENPEQP